VIAGTDIAGMLYDGTFEITPDGFVLGRVKYVLPVGSSTITGSIRDRRTHRVDLATETASRLRQRYGSPHRDTRWPRERQVQKGSGPLMEFQGHELEWLTLGVLCLR
jgi:hypothetical protein